MGKTENYDGRHRGYQPRHAYNEQDEHQARARVQSGLLDRVAELWHTALATGRHRKAVSTTS